MKNLKKTLSVLLSLMLVLGAVAVGGMSASAAEEYNLWVGGVRVTDDNKDDVLGDGTVSYNPVSSTLTLNNATITGEYVDFKIYSGVSNLTIVLIGNNVIPDGSDYGVFTYDGGNLTITGNGTLDFSGNAYSIYSSGTLTIENASVVATSNNYPINSMGALTIKNASVVAKSDGAYSIKSSGDIAIENATVISNSNGYYSIFSDAALTITNSYVSAEATNVCIFAHPLVLGEGLGITEPLGGQNSGKMITLNGQDVQKAVIQPAYTVELSANPTEGGTVSGAGSYAKDGATAKVTATPNEHYNFVNWTENGDEVSTDAEYSFTVSDDRSLVANFEKQKFTVKFVNDDGTELQKSDVAYGETPVYTGETPTKEQSDQYVYTFAGWSPEITSVTTDATYTATFTQAPRKYEIKFVNEDGTELQSGDVAYGETPKYTGETPTKTATAEYTYEFKGWSPEISEVNGTAAYTATFREIPVDYKLTWTVDGESYKNETVPFGTEIVKPDDPVKEGYTFEWVDEIPATMPAQDVTINGEFTPIEYTAKFVDEDGNTVKEVKFTVKTEKLDEPAVPEKTNYTGKWEDYTLGAADMTIKPVYTLGGETVVKAVDTGSEVTSDYKETKEYNFETEYLPEGATTHVFVNGEDKGEGTSVTVEEPTEDYTVECKAFDADGNEIASSGEIKVKVKNSIFDKIKWFFSNLLKNFLDAIFGDFGKIC